MYKKLLSILLAVAMLVSMVPAAYAEDGIVIVEEPAEASDEIVIVEEPAEASDGIRIVGEDAAEPNADSSVDYRALLVGEVNFSFETANRNRGDTELIRGMLANVRGPEGGRYACTVELDLSRDGIRSAIERTFAGADANDVSLFFIATHGVTNLESGDWAGALLTVETPGESDDYLLLGELADWLKAVPGKVIVVLGSCGSGAAIVNNGRLSFTPDAGGRADRSFSEAVIRCFEEADRSLRADEPQTGEFCESKFCVLTAAAHQESSWGQEGYNPYNYFPYYFALGADVGMPADSDADNTVTLNEMYQYCLENAAGPYYDGESYYYQHTQVYPENSSYPLFLSGDQSPYDSIADALAGANGESFTVEGVVTMIEGKNVYVQDGTGGICLYLSANPTGLALGDTVIGTGARATYRGLPELSGASYEKTGGLTLRAADRTIGTLTTADICTYVKLTKLEVTEVNDNNGQYTTPNITVQDEAGAAIQIYKAVVGKTDGEWNVKVGDVIDFTGAVGVYNTTLQLRNTLESEITPWYDPSLPLPLTLDTEATANITEGGAYAYFSYTPDETDFYKLTSFAESDTYGYLYDADWNVLAEDDDSGESYNFRVSAELQAGNTYYFGARYYSSERVGSFPVLLSRDFDNQFSASPVQSSFNVALGETATLEMSVSGRDLSKVSYTWYDGDWNRIEGENGSSLTTPPVRSFLRYYCEVQDGYGYDGTFEFQVSVETHFSYQEPDAVLVPMGECATLEAEVYSDYPDHLSYQWYRYVNGDEGPTLIEGATGPVCVTDPITDSEKSYLCVVSDGFGHRAEIWFNLLVDTHFSAEAVQEEVSVSPGESATLEVLASSDLPLSYQWYDAAWNPIEGETGSSYTTGPATENTYYYCYVSDGINYVHVWFGVKIDTHFRSWVENGDVLAPLGGTAVLEVFAESDAPEQISYQWYQGYRHVEDDGDWWWSWDYSDRIEGATGSRLTVENVTEAGYYVCQVTDGYGSGDNWGIYVYVDTHFSAQAEQQNVWVSIGESAELKVLAESDAPERISYQWYRGFRRFYGEGENDWYWTWDHSGRIEGETGSSLTVGNVTEGAYYVCEASDGFGRTEVLNFTIYLDVHLSAWAEQTEFFLPLGETVTMEVFASSDDPDRISYQWYKEHRVTDGENWWWTSERVEGATGSSLTSEPMTESVNYFCTVYDGYGGSTSIWFRLRLDNHFTAEAVRENFFLSQGETATMEVAASSDEPELISYQWYKAVGDGTGWSVGGNDKIPGATGSSLTSEPVDENACYMCEVSDGYGTTTDVWFYLRVLNVTPIELNVVTTAEIVNQGDYAFFSFVPETTGEYVFVSLTAADTYGCLYDADWNDLASDDDGGTDNNFRIAYELQAGETYYFGARFLNGSVGSFPVVLWLYQDVGFSAYAVQDTVTVALGETAVLEVAASSDDPDRITYQWYARDKVYDDENPGEWHWVNRLLEDETGSRCTTAPVDSYREYFCLVADGHGTTETIWFYVRPDVGFSACAEQSEFRVSAGDTATLTVIATSNEPEKITYQWYRYEKIYYGEGPGDWYWKNVLLEGATDSSYTTAPVTEYTQYMCSVGDGYGTAENIWFSVFVDTHFEARAEQGYVYVPVGDTATLTVIATSDEPEKITYQWYRYEKIYYGEGPDDWYWEAVLLEGATGSSYTTGPITEYVQYRCEVSDGYGASKGIRFSVYVDTHLQAHTDQSDFTVALGDTATLSVTATSDDPERIGYRWYKLRKEVNGDGSTTWWYDDPIEGATGSSYTTGPVMEMERYACCVYDGYGSEVDISFYVRPDTGFTAYAEQSELRVPVGDTATLTVIATSNKPEKISYQWQAYDEETGWASIEGATGSSYTTDPITKYRRYSCRVEDGYGSSVSLYFNVYADTHFSARAVRQTVYVPLGEAATLAVEASSDYPLSYVWYRDSEPIEGETGATLTTAPLTGSSYSYHCVVSDGYNSGDIWFWVFIESELEVRAVQEVFYVQPGETVDLEVLVSTLYPDSLEIFWQKGEKVYYDTPFDFYWEYRLLEEAKDTRYTTEPITRYSHYLCTVMDGFGRGFSVEFDIYIDTDFSAEAVQEELYVPSGETATLAVNASVKAPGELSYQWYSTETDIWLGMINWYDVQPIEGENGPTLVTDPVTSFAIYLCQVSDGYGNEKLIKFSVHVQTQFSAEAEQTELYVSPGDAATMRVNASCSEPGVLNYTWVELITYVDGEFEYHELNHFEEKGPTLTLDGVTGYHEIWCVVSDGCGNTKTLYFYVHVQNHFSAEAVNPLNFVEGDGTVELQLSLSGDDLTGVSYQWYSYRFSGIAMGVYDYYPIDGAFGSSYFASTEYELYRCVVKDRYGTPIAVDFEVYKSAEPEGFKVSYGTLPGGVTVSGIESGALYSGELSFTVASQNDRAVLVAVKTADGYEILPCTTDGSGVHRFTLNVTAETELALVYRGDADGNGKVNMRDSLAIKKHSAGTETLSGLQLLAANADGDAGGKVNMRDSLTVKKDSAGTEKIKW